MQRDRVGAGSRPRANSATCTTAPVVLRRRGAQGSTPECTRRIASRQNVGQVALRVSRLGANIRLWSVCLAERRAVDRSRQAIRGMLLFGAAFLSRLPV